MSQFMMKTDSTRLQRSHLRRKMWFWRGILVAAVTHSVLAAADFSVDVESVWSDLGEPTELHSAEQIDLSKKLVEFELQDDALPSVASSAEKKAETSLLAASTVVLNGLKFPLAVIRATVQDANEQSTESDDNTDKAEPESDAQSAKTAAAKSSAIEFPTDVPASEILRVSRAFHGMVQESMRTDPNLLSEQFLGSLAESEPLSPEKLSELETSLLDERAEEEGYELGLAVDSEGSMLDPFKTYTVVNGRIHAVTPTQVARPERMRSVAQSVDLLQAEAPSKDGDPGNKATSPAPSLAQSKSSEGMGSAGLGAAASNAQLTLPQDEVSKGISDILSNQRSAALDNVSAESDRVTIQGRVLLPEGFARDKVALRMAGTPFQVQTDAAGSFELRDVPRGTRFELLVWHLEGSLTRRLIPVTASGREKVLEIALQKLSDVDALAGSFGLLQQMNQGGFCARVENQSADALVGGRVVVTAGRKNLQAHFFTDNSLPSAGQSELSSDGRFCVFNIEESIVDVKVKLVNGTRRQFVVHVEPTTFEHDLIFDVSESIYRRISLMEPLDAQQVFQLSSQGVQPDFGDRRLRDWLQGADVPVWTRVERFLFQSDPAYSVVRPKGDDLQFFPGGQEFVELRVAPDVPGSPWSRIMLSRDDLMTQPILKQIESLKNKVYQDREKSMSIAALDADAWDDLVSQNADVPRLQADTVGGLYLSIDPSGLNVRAEDLSISVRDTWTGKDVCKVVPLRGSSEIKAARYLRAVCGAAPGQYALIIETKEGALLWSDVVRIRDGDVQTVTVFDPKF